MRLWRVGLKYGVVVEQKIVDLQHDTVVDWLRSRALQKNENKIWRGYFTCISLDR